MSHKNGLAMISWVLVIQLGLIGFAYFQFAFRSPGQFFGRLPDNTPFEITALDRPNVSTSALLNWVTLAATATFTFDFFNYQKQLEALKDYFTSDGYNNFLASVDSAGVLNTIEEKKLILSAVAIGPAIVLSEEVSGTLHTWRIQVPILVHYQSANVDETRQQIVDMLITQVSTQDAPKGIGIAQYIAREAGSDVNI